MAPIYTHTFKLHVGGQTIEGEMEFDDDGVMSYKETTSADRLTLSQSQVLNELFSRLKDVFNTFESIEEIEVTEK